MAIIHQIVGVGKDGGVTGVDSFAGNFHVILCSISLYLRVKPRQVGQIGREFVCSQVATVSFL